MSNKKINLLLFITILILATLACNLALPQTESISAPTQSVGSTPQGRLGFPQTEADVPRISVEDAKAALDNGEAVIVDVRSPALFADEHVKSALSIPLALIESDVSSLDLDKKQWIITYCT